MKLSVSGKSQKYISIILKCVCVLLAALLVVMLQQVRTYAYFDRGEVDISLGLYETTAEAGSSVNVTVSFSPESSEQLPGCGMAECPQICGDGCLDENGECTCNGTDFETYYPSASVTSSNTSVATASYSNGVVSIYAVSQGTAEITVTASLRQFRSTSATINVSVTEPYTEPTTESRETQTSGDKKESSGDSSGTPVETKQISGNDYSYNADENESTTKEDSSETTSDDVLSRYSKISSGRGDIYFVEKTDGESAAAVLKAIKGKDVYADFQNKDASDTVIYSWEFLGTDITGTVDTTDTAGYDLTLTTSKTAFTGMKNAPEGALYVSFDGEGKLPGEAELNLRVAESFENDEAVYVYEYSDNGNLVKSGDAVNVSNGYIALNLDEKVKLVLSTEEIKNAGKEAATTVETTDETSTGTESETTTAAGDADSSGEASGFPFWVIIIIVVVAAGAAAAIILKVRASKNKE